jgi:hypothetical protein
MALPDRPISIRSADPATVHRRSRSTSGVSEREAAIALLRLKADLVETLGQPPKHPEAMPAWSRGVSTLLIEAARGRLYLLRLRDANHLFDDGQQSLLVERLDHEIQSA